MSSTATGGTTHSTVHPILRRWVLPIVAVLLTGLAAGVMLWNLQTRQTAGPVIPVAIVNSDKSVTTGSGSDEKTIYAGRQLAANLTQPDSKDVTPLSWQLVDKADADKGLIDGTYYAVLTIPEDFSKNINSVSGKSPVEAELKLVSNDASSTAVGAMASLTVQQAAIGLGGQITNNYVNNSLNSFTDIHNNLTSSAKSAQQLADSSSELADSTKEIASSSEELDSGASQLAQGTASLAAGAQTLSSGAEESAEGATEVASGAQQLDTAIDGLATGAADVATIASRLSTGATRVARVNSGLSTGATRLAGVNRGLATGATRVARLDRGVSAGATRVDRLNRGLDVATTAHARGLTTSTRLAEAAESRTGDVATRAEQLRDDYCPGSNPIEVVLCDRLTVLAVDARLGAGESTVVANRISTATDVADRISTASGVAAQASTVVAGGAGVAAEASTVLARGAGVAAEASTVLARGADGAAEASTVLARGVSGLAAATDDLSEGVSGLDTAAGSLASGASSAATGAVSVAEGAAETASGATELAVSADQLADGANSLATGADSLATGADSLASGADSLASGLDSGAKQIPSYTKDQTTQIATVVTTPVGVKPSAQPGATAAASLVPVLLGMALWLGTLMMFLVRAAVPTSQTWAQASSGRRVLLGWLPAAGVGVAQTALLMGLVLFSGVKVDNTLGLALFCGLAALSFAATNQALVALFGGFGRLVSLAFAVIEAAALGGLAPIETAPTFIQMLNGILPLPQFVNGATQMVIGGISGDIVGACVVLAGWMFLALAVSVVATARTGPRLAPASADASTLVPAA